MVRRFSSAPCPPLTIGPVRWTFQIKRTRSGVWDLDEAEVYCLPHHALYDEGPGWVLWLGKESHIKALWLIRKLSGWKSIADCLIFRGTHQDSQGFGYRARIGQEVLDASPSWTQRSIFVFAIRKCLQRKDVSRIVIILHTLSLTHTHILMHRHSHSHINKHTHSHTPYSYTDAYTHTSMHSLAHTCIQMMNCPSFSSTIYFAITVWF